MLGDPLKRKFCSLGSEQGMCLGGLLVVQVNPDHQGGGGGGDKAGGEVQVGWVHDTDHMGVGYAVGGGTDGPSVTPKVFISSRTNETDETSEQECRSGCQGFWLKQLPARDVSHL
jgi:hypothetical protein